MNDYSTPQAILWHEAVKAKLINGLCDEIHIANERWWRDLATGEPILITSDLVGHKLMLVVTELAEAEEGNRTGRLDDKLPTRPMLEVELADAVIRIMDLAAALHLDLGGAFVEKLEYNRTRRDHSREARLADGGKKA